MHLVKKIAAGVPVAALALIGPAFSAHASTHPSRFTFHAAVPATAGPPTYNNQGSAGYAATGANFASVTETATLRDPSEYASVTDGLGFGVTLASDSTEVDIGVSNSTTSGSLYYPAVDLYVGGVLQTGAPEYNAVWCAAGSTTCGPAGDATNGGFPDGDQVTETLTFNKANGVMDYTAYDAAGNVFTGQFGGLKGQTFGTADVGAGFDPGVFTSPATAEKFVTFGAVSLTSSTGTHYTLASSALTTTEQIATSDGTSTGLVEAKPSALLTSGKGFSVSFEPNAAG